MPAKGLLPDSVERMTCIRLLLPTESLHLSQFSTGLEVQRCERERERERATEGDRGTDVGHAQGM